MLVELINSNDEYPVVLVDFNPNNPAAPVPLICRIVVGLIWFITGVVIVGLVPNTAGPVPVSSVNAARRLALVGVSRNAATFVPSPLIPVEIGKPVQDVRVPLDGVPSGPPL